MKITWEKREKSSRLYYFDKLVSYSNTVVLTSHPVHPLTASLSAGFALGGVGGLSSPTAPVWQIPA